MRPTSASESLTVRGTIRTVFYAGARFSAGKLETPDGREITFSGKFYAKAGELVVLEGSWIQHPKFGRQFDVRSMRYDLDFDVDGLATYLANHPKVKGIGPVKARLIADRFGKEFGRWLDEQPESIAAVAKVPLESIYSLREEWERTKAVNGALLHLSAFDLSHGQVTGLVEKFGASVVQLLHQDPYLLVREVKGLGFKKVDKLARAVGTPKELPGRIRAGLAFELREALDSGDCWVESEDLIDRTNGLLVMDQLDSRDRIEAVLDQLLDEGAFSCKEHGGKFLISDPVVRQQEEDLAEIFQRGGGSSHFRSNQNLSAEITRDHPLLNPEQAAAVETSLQSSISVLSGGAGVGKTFSVQAIVALAEKRKLRVVLAAPTGKAAKRLEQVVDRPASTIHRLLGYDGRDFLIDQPIRADVLIVDEVSMVDVPLAWQLFKWIDLKKTSVILVGDHNQLPPVGPGNILRDLIESRVIPTSILGTVVRQAGILKENSIAVLSGEIRKTSDREDSGRRAWYVADQFGDQVAAQKFVLDLFDKILAERLGFDLIRDVQVLTPTHKGPLGTGDLNLEIRRLVQRKLFGVETPETPPHRRPRFLVHDKIIQTRNDYETGVMNGAVGFVREARNDGSLTIDFDGRPIEFPTGSPGLTNLQLAYAMTIHRSQGSEFPCTIAVVHKAHSFMHHRNLLYTAVTRARQTAILVGDRWGMRNCADRRETSERKTFLSFLLAERRTTEETVAVEAASGR